MSKLKKVTHTALIIAIVLVLRNFSYMVSFGGAGGMRIGIGGFFSKLPAIMFGPVYGGITSGIVDVLGFLIKPEGGYMFPLTLTAILGGIMTGLLWRCVKNINTVLFRRLFLSLFLCVGALGIVNTLFAGFGAGTAYAAYIASFGKRAEYLTVWFTAAGIIAAAIFGADALVRKKAGGYFSEEFIKILTVLLISNVTVTTLNTVILMSFMPSLAKLGFTVFYIPRLAEEIISTIIQSWVVSFLVSLYEKMTAN